MATITVKQYVMLLTSQSIVCAASAHTPGQISNPYNFGKELIACETDCVELNQFGIDNIDDIEAYVESHGGIDVEATTSKAIERALKSLEPYKGKGL